MVNPLTHSGNLEVELVGRGSLILRPADYVAQGGEGIIYRAGETIVKLYLDQARVAARGLADKIRHLTKFRHPYVVAPDGLVQDRKAVPIGFYMPFAHGEPLARVFTTAYWLREGFNDGAAKDLVERMRETVAFAHDQGALLVDANELNWKVLLQGGRPEPRVLDIDSWQLGRWKAAVIMPSIRDWHATDFSTLTDWFSWGIVTFQVFTGTHPYKGRLDGFKPGDLEARMRANASVFRAGVSLNQAVRDFAGIPPALLQWYQSTFEDGVRREPPSVHAAVVTTPKAAQIARIVTTATGSLVYDLVFRGQQKILRLWSSGVILLKNGDLVNLGTQRPCGHLASPDGEVMRVDDGWITADRVNHYQQFRYVADHAPTGQADTVRFDLAMRRVFRSDNRLFAVTEDQCVELTFANPGRPVLSAGARTSILQPQATQWFDGVAIAEAFGATFLLTPFGARAFVTTRVRELDGLRPLDARAGHRFVTVIAADKSGTYHKLEFYFSENYAEYRVWRGITDQAALNLAILPRGVCATIVNDGELTIFVPANGKTTVVSDRRITTGLVLGNWENRVVFVDRNEVWSVRMK